MNTSNEVERLVEALAPVTGELRRVIDDASERMARLHSVIQAFESAASSEENPGMGGTLYHPHLYQALLMLMPNQGQLSDEIHRGLTRIDEELDAAEGSMAAPATRAGKATRREALMPAPQRSAKAQAPSATNHAGTAATGAAR